MIINVILDEQNVKHSKY